MASTRTHGAWTRSNKQCVVHRDWQRKSSLLLAIAILPFLLLNGCAGVVSRAALVRVPGDAPFASAAFISMNWSRPSGSGAGTKSRTIS